MVHIMWGNRKNPGAPNLSQPEEAWRLGSGNMHKTSESDNAEANIHWALQTYQDQVTKPLSFIKLVADYSRTVVTIDGSVNLSGDKKYTEIVGSAIFTMRDDIAIMALSGDAHTLVFSSDKAIAVVIAAWHCLKQDIMGDVLAKFQEHGINPSEISINIGPGLGAESYTLDEQTKTQIAEILSRVTNSKGESFYSETLINTFLHPKEKQKPGTIKYKFDLAEMIKQWGNFMGIKEVNATYSADTFDKQSWKMVKAAAQESHTIDPLLHFYGDQTYFGARLFSRVVRQANRVMKSTDQSGSSVPTLDPVKTAEQLYAMNEQNISSLHIPVYDPNKKAELYNQTGRNGNIASLAPKKR